MLQTCEAMYVSMSAKHCASPIGKQGEGGRLRSRSLHSPHTCMRSGSKKMDRRADGLERRSGALGGENTCTFFLPFLISQCSQNKWTRRAIFLPPPRASIAKTEWGRDQGYLSLLHFFGRSRAQCCTIHIGERNIITCMHHYALFFLSVFHCKQLGTKTDWPSVL